MKSEDVLQKRFSVITRGEKKVSIPEVDEFIDLIVETLRYYEYPKYAPKPLVDSTEVRNYGDKIARSTCFDKTGFNKTEVTKFFGNIVKTLEQHEKGKQND